jgi:conjugative transposon TraM protein
MQRNLSASTSRFAGSGNYGAGTYHDYGYDDDVNNRLEEIQRKSRQRMKDLLNEPDSDEEARAEANRIAREEMQRKIQEEAPSEVIKASTLQHRNFNTVNTYAGETSDSPLIKAMIDKTTKSTEGTRLRFKLLDDVIIDDIKLLKGSYLYGTVSGFGTQRVMANITSVLVGSRFLKVNLCVYDIDGMEGFYVPASSFREFVQNAAAGVAGQQIQFSNNGNSGDINPEMLALQALQNIYQAGSSALSRNIKKNKAKIKYNTIVYLINSNNVK